MKNECIKNELIKKELIRYGILYMFMPRCDALLAPALNFVFFLTAHEA